MNEVVVGEGRWVGERSEMGVGSVSEKLGSGQTFSGSSSSVVDTCSCSSFLAVLVAATEAGVGKGEEGMTRWRVGARVFVLRNSCIVMCSPDALSRSEKMTTESRSANATSNWAGVDKAMERRCEVRVSGVHCSPRVKRGCEVLEGDVLYKASRSARTRWD